MWKFMVASNQTFLKLLSLKTKIARITSKYSNFKVFGIFVAVCCMHQVSQSVNSERRIHGIQRILNCEHNEHRNSTKLHVTAKNIVQYVESI